MGRRGSRMVPDASWWSSSGSIGHRLHKQLSQDAPINSSPEQEPAARSEDETVKKNKKWYMMIVEVFDLDLLKDPGYRTLWLGMSVAFTAEINFSLLTPIILGDRGFDVQDTAKVMSVIAVADIVFRFVSPFVGERLNITARYMYMWSILLLVVFRFGLTLVESYWATMAVCVGLGVAKGFRSVYATLVIPNYVSLEKLASASGLQTVLNGVLLMCFGPLLGWIRDVSGSYDMCIYAINGLTLLTIAMWTVEYLLSNKTDPQSAANEHDEHEDSA